jgi:hypothetical protein
MNRVEPFEKDFKKRYNRDVEVYREVHTKNNLFESVDIKIVYKGKEFFLTEYLTPEQLTAYVIVKIGDKEYQYRNYLEAEVQVADAIGELDGDTI